MLRVTTISIPLLFSLFIILMTPNGVAPAISPEDFTVKISFEKYLEEKLMTALSKILGTERIVVTVNADVEAVKGRSGYGRKGKMVSKKSKDAQVLPGVPVKKEIGKGQSQTAEIAMPDSFPSDFMVRRLAVSIVIDDSASESTMDMIRDVAQNVAGYNAERGDQLDIKQLNFKMNQISFTSVYWLILSIVGAFFLVAASLFLMDPFKKLSQAMRNIDWNLVRRGIPSSPQSVPIETRHSFAENAMQNVRQETVDKSAMPFSYIQEKHLSDLAYLLKDAPPKDVVIVINFLTPDYVSKLLGFFPEDRQAEILLNFSSEVVIPERVHELEEMIKGTLDYVIGGDRKIIPILDMADDDFRERIFSSIEKNNPNVAKRLRSKVRSLESLLLSLPSQGLQALYRRVDPAIYAQILKTLHQDIQARVIDALSAGAAERLRQEMDLSTPLSTKRLQKEKHNIVRVIRQMVEEGQIEEMETPWI